MRYYAVSALSIRGDLLGKLGFQHIKELVDMDEIIW
jgi:hypothetical protein